MRAAPTRPDARIHGRSLAGALAVLAAIVASVLLGAPAYAADASIAHVEPTDDGLQVLVSVPPRGRVDLAGVSVSVDGAPAEATAVRARSSTAVERTAVLAIDTSRSMAGEQFLSARQAARTYVDSLPDDVQVGIVTFAGTVTEQLVPTTDHAQALAVLDGLTLSQQTRLYEGVRAAVELAGTEGQRSVLVLSDGADTTDDPLEETTALVRERGVLLDVVALDQSGRALDALGRLADAGSGRVVEASAEALVAAFGAEAAALARQVLVTVQVPAEVTATEATLHVTLPTGAGELVAEAFTTVRGAGGPAVAAPPRPAGSGWMPPQWVMYAGLGAFAVGLLAVAVLLVPSRRSGELTLEQRVARYTHAGPADSHEWRVDTDAALAQAKDAAANVLRHNRSLDERITHRLEGAGSSLKSAEWLLVQVGVFLLAGLVGALLGGGSLLIGLVFLAVGAVGPWLYLGLRRSRRRKAFDAALPDVLQLVSGSLSAGLSLAQSIDTVVREGGEPVSSEFKRVLMETRLGVSLEDALEGVAERFESKDFGWVVMAIRIQRQVGGNLGELLDTVATTMREREYVRRQVAALSAEGKLSAVVLGGLPPAFLLYLLVANREYVMPLFTDPRGWVMLAGATLWLAVGVFWMSRLVKVEV